MPNDDFDDDWLPITCAEDLARVRRDMEEEQAACIAEVPDSLRANLARTCGSDWVAENPDLIRVLARKVQRIMEEMIQESWAAFDAAQAARLH